jgi:hypothetical protein
MAKPGFFSWLILRKVLTEVIFPMQAIRSFRESGRSLKRTATMLKTGKPLAPSSESQKQQPAEEAEEVAKSEQDLLARGREIVLSLYPEARFEAMAVGLNVTPADIDQKMVAMARAHAVRLCFLYFCVFMLPALGIKVGGWAFFADMVFVFSLSIRCLRSGCLYTQLEERSLIEFGDFIKRPPMWVLARVFWFVG